MPLWRRSRRDASRSTPESPKATELGGLPCTEVDCIDMTGLLCEYVDRRGRHCRTAWCPQHRVVLNNRVYCRRHGGVVAAVPYSANQPTAALPDIDNRAPSLVNWVSRELDAAVRTRLLSEVTPQAPGELVADPVALVFTGFDRHRAWEKAWKLVGHTGTTRRVSLLVEETLDSEVVVKVGTNVVDRLVPPWIERRTEAGADTPIDDEARRERFNERILEAIDRGLARDRDVTSYAEREGLEMRPDEVEELWREIRG